MTEDTERELLLEKLSDPGVKEVVAGALKHQTLLDEVERLRKELYEALKKLGLTEQERDHLTILRADDRAETERYKTERDDAVERSVKLETTVENLTTQIGQVHVNLQQMLGRLRPPPKSEERPITRFPDLPPVKELEQIMRDNGGGHSQREPSYPYVGHSDDPLRMEDPR
jgi:hypothetical protein